MSAEDLAAPAKQLDAANAILPGRVNLYELSPDLASSLARAVELAHTEKPGSPVFREYALGFLERATAERYRARSGVLGGIDGHGNLDGTIGKRSDGIEGDIIVLGMGVATGKIAK